MALGAVSTLIVLSGCATIPLGEPDATPEPPLGEVWIEIPHPPQMSADANYVDGFSSGGALWVYDQSAPTVLYGTSDGATWRTVDVVDEGVTLENGKLAFGCAEVTVATTASTTVPLLYHSAYVDKQPDSLQVRTWIVELGDTEVGVSDGASNGLQVMPPDQAGWAFRTRCAEAMVTLGDSRVIVGRGQWWKPYNTGNSNPYVAVEDSTGSWKVHASFTAPFFKEDTMHPFHISTVGNRIVVLDENYDEPSKFSIWSSADTVNWEQAKNPVPPSTTIRDKPSVASSENGIAVWSVEEDGSEVSSHIWTSRDGQTWEYSMLPGTEWRVATIDADESGFTAHTWRQGSEEQRTKVWTSVDGSTWATQDEESPNASRRGGAIAHDGGLALILRDKILVSGLPWVAPEAP